MHIQKELYNIYDVLMQKKKHAFLLLHIILYISIFRLFLLIRPNKLKCVSLDFLAIKKKMSIFVIKKKK